MKTVEILGDSILKGIQLDPETEKYVVRNDIGLDALAAEYGLAVTNRSHFGSTAERGARLLERLLERGLACDAVVMDFGGNDSDFQWAEVAAHPEEEHPPAYSPEAFTDIYRAMWSSLPESPSQRSSTALAKPAICAVASVPERSPSSCPPPASSGLGLRTRSPM